MVFLITGGSGFLGRAIIEELHAEENRDLASEIRVFDLLPPSTYWDDSITYIQGDIRDKDKVNEALQGVDIVIHSAAIVDWGTRTEKEILDINVGGTANVINGCKRNNVPHFIYTSSLDAIYGGKPLRNINESVPYPDRHITWYCASKYKAELLVKSAAKDGLNTCILRPSDIYGENDPYHIDSLINMAKNGFYVRLGNGEAKCQHVYVRNMAHAHILIAKAFKDKNEVVNGNVYFITDGPGTNFFKFFDQVVEGAGYKIWPKNLWLPQWLAYFIGSLTEFYAWIISPIKKTNPKFSRFAVAYTCSDFTFNASKAKRDFGYVPKYSEEEGLLRTIAFYKNQREEN